MKKIILSVLLLLTSMYANSYKDDWRYNKSWAERTSELNKKSYSERYQERLEKEQERREERERARQSEYEQRQYEREQEQERKEIEENEKQEQKQILEIPKEFKGKITNIREYDDYAIVTINNTLIKIEKYELENYIDNIKNRLTVFGQCNKRNFMYYNNVYFDCDINFEY